MPHLRSISYNRPVPSVGATLNIWFLIAGISSFAVCLTHISLGGRVAARPLLDATELRPIAKYTNYYCWHIVSIVIAGMGVMFFVSAFFRSAFELAWVAIIFATLFSLWNIVLYWSVRKHFRHWYELPQWVLFAPIAAFGLIGVYCG